MHRLMCPRSGVSRQRSHLSTEQQLLAESDGLELAQLCIRLCCCSVSRRASAATPQLMTATKSGVSQPGRVTGFHKPCSSTCHVDKNTLERSTEARRGSKRHLLLVPLSGRDNAPCLQPGVQPRQERHAFLPLLATAVAPSPAQPAQQSWLPWTISYSPEKPQRGKAIEKKPTKRLQPQAMPRRAVLNHS